MKKFITALAIALGITPSIVNAAAPSFNSPDKGERHSMYSEKAPNTQENPLVLDDSKINKWIGIVGPNCSSSGTTCDEAMIKFTKLNEGKFNVDFRYHIYNPNAQSNFHTYAAENHEYYVNDSLVSSYNEAQKTGRFLTYYWDAPSYVLPGPGTYKIQNKTKPFSAQISNATEGAVYIKVLPVKYNINFKNDDGSVLQNSLVESGQTPSYNGATPTKAKDAEYTYEFNNWDSPIGPATSDKDYTATYNKTKNSYTINFVLDNDQENKTISKTLEYGSEVTPPDEKACKEHFHFKNWDKPLAPVSGDETYTAVCEEDAKFNVGYEYKPNGDFTLPQEGLNKLPENKEVYTGETVNNELTGNIGEMLGHDNDYDYKLESTTPENKVIDDNFMFDVFVSRDPHKYNVKYIDGEDQSEILTIADVIASYGDLTINNSSKPELAGYDETDHSVNFNKQDQKFEFTIMPKMYTVIFKDNADSSEILNDIVKKQPYGEKDIENYKSNPLLEDYDLTDVPSTVDFNKNNQVFEFGLNKKQFEVSDAIVASKDDEETNNMIDKLYKEEIEKLIPEKRKVEINKPAESAINTKIGEVLFDGYSGLLRVVDKTAPVEKLRENKVFNTYVKYEPHKYTYNVIDEKSNKVLFTKEVTDEAYGDKTLDVPVLEGYVIKDSDKLVNFGQQNQVFNIKAHRIPNTSAVRL